MRRHQSLFSQAAFLAAVILAGGRAAHAGGPLYVNLNGQPFAWDTTRPIPYTASPGPLGRFSNAQAVEWLAQAFQRWAGVEGAALTFQATAPYSVNITGKNVMQVMDALPADVNLIIFDNDGSVLDTLFGEGTSENVLGLSAPTGFDFDPSMSRIMQAWAIVSGRLSGLNTSEYLQGVIQHELGHFLNLAHSQLNPQIVFSGAPNHDLLAPRMSYNQGPNDGPTLHLEDRAWIAALYPKAGVAPKTGAIQGRVLLPDGQTGLQGIQVAARRDGDEEITAVTAVSGYGYKESSGWGSRDVTLQGFYQLPSLPPGNYRLAIEQLEGPPQGAVPPRQAFLPGGRRFWRESGPLANQSQEATLVSVSAGQVVKGKDFVLDGVVPPMHELRQVQPNILPERAPTLELPAAITGHVGPQDRTVVKYRLSEGRRDAVADWYRVTVTEPTTLSAMLTASNPAADLNLRLVQPIVGLPPVLWPPVDCSSVVLDPGCSSSLDRGTPPETFQLRVLPGVYFVAVSRVDSPTNPETDFRLTVLATSSPDLPQAAPNPPRITLATISNLRPTGLRVSWQTDQDANAVLYVGNPLRDLGNPALTREHVLDVTGLEEGTFYTLSLFSRNSSAERTSLPGVVVNTPSADAGKVPLVSAGLLSAMPQDQKNEEFLLVAQVSNLGNGPASSTKIERLELPSGWRFVAPPALPLDLGEIGAGAASVLAVRVSRTADAAPLDLIVQGSYATIDGTIRAFGR
jgi:hypothetical protein